METGTRAIIEPESAPVTLHTFDYDSNPKLYQWPAGTPCGRCGRQFRDGELARDRTPAGAPMCAECEYREWRIDCAAMSEVPIG